MGDGGTSMGTMVVAAAVGAVVRTESPEPADPVAVTVGPHLLPIRRSRSDIGTKRMPMARWRVS
jgi:hypothetical protein